MSLAVQESVGESEIPLAETNLYEQPLRELLIEQRRLLPTAITEFKNFDTQLAWRPYNPEHPTGDFAVVVEKDDGSLVCLLADIAGKGGKVHEEVRKYINDNFKFCQEITKSVCVGQLVVELLPEVDNLFRQTEEIEISELYSRVKEKFREVLERVFERRYDGNMPQFMAATLVTIDPDGNVEIKTDGSNKVLVVNEGCIDGQYCESNAPLFHYDQDSDGAHKFTLKPGEVFLLSTDGADPKIATLVRYLKSIFNRNVKVDPLLYAWRPISKTVEFLRGCPEYLNDDTAALSIRLNVKSPSIPILNEESFTTH